MSTRRGFAVAGLVASAAVAHAGSDAPSPVQAVAVGDFDGDGKPDIAAGLPDVNVGKLKKAGEVRIFRAEGGAFVRKNSGGSAEESYGVSLAAVGDIDKDGATDLAIAAPFGDRGPCIEIVSGKSGRVILTKKCEQPAEIQWGDAICALGDGSGKARVDLLVRWVQQEQWRVYFTDQAATGGSFPDDAGYFSHVTLLGDVNGDGHRDLALANFASDEGGKKSAGNVRVISGELLMRGRADENIFRLAGTFASESLGLSVAPAGDWDGDEKADVLVSSAGQDERKGSWLVRVYSGKDGKEIWKAAGAAGDWHAPSVALVGDADGDGKSDVAVGTPAVQSAAGAVAVLSAKDGTALWTLKGATKENCGEELLPFPDADADGVADLLVLSPGAAVKGAKGNGYIRIVSGKTGAPVTLINPLVAK